MIDHEGSYWGPNQVDAKGFEQLLFTPLYMRPDELKRAGMDWMQIMPLVPENKRERLVAELQADSTYATQERRASEFITRGGGCWATYFNHARRLKEKGLGNGKGRRSTITV